MPIILLLQKYYEPFLINCYETNLEIAMQVGPKKT